MNFFYNKFFYKFLSLCFLGCLFLFYLAYFKWSYYSINRNCERIKWHKLTLMTIKFKLYSNSWLFHFFIFFLAVFMYISLTTIALNNFLYLLLIRIYVKFTIIRITMAINWRLTSKLIIIQHTGVIIRSMNIFYFQIYV
jgi:hypothetical protein